MVPPSDGMNGDGSRPPGIRRGRPPMRGSSRLTPRNWTTGATVAAPASAHGMSQPSASPVRRRVLFVCIGNSCRSQMAEGFARAYGSDVLDVESAGLSPAGIIQPLTIQTMLERNVRLDGQRPKGVEVVLQRPFDLVVNMSGQRLPAVQGAVVDWPIPDPIGRTAEVYRNVAAQIEGLVVQLVLHVRSDLSRGFTP